MNTADVAPKEATVLFSRNSLNGLCWLLVFMGLLVAIWRWPLPRKRETPAAGVDDTSGTSAQDQR